jgi:hypothetical protein
VTFTVNLAFSGMYPADLEVGHLRRWRVRPLEQPRLTAGPI